MSSNEVCKGQVIIEYLLDETEYTYMYLSYIKQTGVPCISKQYKVPVTNDIVMQELELFCSNTADFLPAQAAPRSKEPDGQFFAFFTLFGEPIQTILSTESSLDAIDAKNICIQFFNLIKFLAKKGVRLLKVPNPRFVFYSKREPKVLFLDILEHEKSKKSEKEIIIESIPLVKGLLALLVQWIEDLSTESETDMLLNDSEKEAVNFFVLCDKDPELAIQHAFVNGNLVSLFKKIESVPIDFSFF